MNYCWLKKLSCVTVLTMLIGCVTTEDFVSEPKPEKFDGVWSGLITLSLGDDSCMRRENFILRITEGRIEGKTRDIKYKTQIVGDVEEDGSISNGEFLLGTVQRNAEMFGQFDLKNASGEWKSKRCKGKWTLRRIQ